MVRIPNNQLSIGRLWVLNINQVMSLAIYVRCAVFTHGAFLLLVLFLLVVGFCINSKEGDFKKMIATPMYMVFPMYFSKFGLSERQQARVKFYASSVAVRLLCCVTFWAIFWTQMSADIRQVAVSGCPLAAYDHWGGEDLKAEVDRWVASWSDEAEEEWTFGDCSKMPAFLGDVCNSIQDDVSIFAEADRARFVAGKKFAPTNYVSCLVNRSPLLRNICMTEACVCQMLSDIEVLLDNSYSISIGSKVEDIVPRNTRDLVQGWETSFKILLYFPSISLALWLLCSLTLPQLLGLAQYFSCYDGAFWMLGTAQQNPIMRDKIHHQSKQLAPQIAQKEVKASCKQRLQLHLEFFLLLLDVVSDVNCLVQLLSSKQHEVAIIQACAILLPILVDCYRSRGRSFQLVEVVKGFVASRKVGFPTDDYILALQAEKGLEAPLSFMIQYYTVFRLTSIVSFYSVLCSIPLSIYSMSKFVYVQFEFCILEAVEKKTEELNEEANSAKNQPSQPFFQGLFPQSFGRPKVLDTEWRQDPFKKPARELRVWQAVSSCSVRLAQGTQCPQLRWVKVWKWVYAPAVGVNAWLRHT